MLLSAHDSTWFAKLVAYRRLLIGVALIAGAFAGIAGFLGGFMNWNFMMAGTTSANPVLFVNSTGPILAWTVSRSFGSD